MSSTFSFQSAECFTCLKKKSSSPCQCGLYERSFVDTYCTNELHYCVTALSHVILEIVEGLVFTKTDTSMVRLSTSSFLASISKAFVSLQAKYFNLLASYKIRHQPLPDNLSEEQKKAYLEDINNTHNFPPDLSLTVENCLPRADAVFYYKLVSNRYVRTIYKSNPLKKIT